MQTLHEFFQDRQDSILSLLRALVEIESPSQDKAAVDRVADFACQRMQAAGAGVERYPQAQAGDIVLGRWPAGDQRKPVTLLCHMDTVWPVGTLAARPARQEGDRFYGPGAFDMKAGLAIALAALEGLRELGEPLPGPAWLLCTSDEETGSHASRPLIEQLAGESALVIVLEPAMPGGALKTSRKGVGEYLVRAAGRASHAGANHRKGVNAIQEMAHQILAIQALTDYARGTTVSVGVIRGGTASNVVPAECEVEVDFRVAALEEARRLHEAITGLQPRLPGAEVQARGGLNRPPMPRDERMARTFAAARRIAARHGFRLEEDGTGGASDANFTAALGVPTLDGMGADGDGGHALHEHVLLASLPARAALLAAILREWGQT